MAVVDWPQAILFVRPYIVKISTPRVSGTGFLITSAKSNNLCGIATAAHVVNNAHYWEEPIRIQQIESGQSTLFRPADRAILVDDSLDTAAIVVDRGSFTFPETQLELIPEKMSLKLGHEVGWLGFPALAPGDLCFFTGRASCWRQEAGEYLVDGVAINGVSGGPAFHLAVDVPVRVIGVVSAYIANRATGEALPGLCVIRDVKQLQDLIKRFRSMDEAKEEERPPSATPPAPPNPPAEGVPTGVERRGA